jgi:predicted Zn-dependent protease with MMP-like domain
VRSREQRLSAYRATTRRARFSRATFERLVERALQGLPERFAERLSNVAVVVEERPNPHKLASLGFGPRESLMGLYEGTPLGQRGTGYHLAVPDRITIYRQPILAVCGDEEEIVREIRATVLHEVGHFFGLSDKDMEE